MRIKPVAVPDLVDAFLFALDRAEVRLDREAYAKDFDSRQTFWNDLYKDLITYPFTHHHAARVLGLMWAIERFPGDRTPEIRQRAIERAAVAPIDRVTLRFRDPEALFL
jgi:hypothetical protein